MQVASTMLLGTPAKQWLIYSRAFRLQSTLVAGKKRLEFDIA
jgi:hypothetical protein